jgi:hypothetical protein
MKKFNMVEFKPVSTPMSMATVLDPDKMVSLLIKESTEA